ncbi:uncharacterized protein [Miscanthus floridulus]|uniref:uncharacterized protein n=1 Tax=Miscanthus floridulus TaxID=154761 RepID=UPI0034585123
MRAIASPHAPPRPEAPSAVRSRPNAPENFPTSPRHRRPCPPPPTTGARALAADHPIEPPHASSHSDGRPRSRRFLPRAHLPRGLCRRRRPRRPLLRRRLRIPPLRAEREEHVPGAGGLPGRRAAGVPEFSSLSVEPCDSELIVVTVFEIKEEEVPAFIEREHEFRFLAVVPEGLDGVPFTNRAVVCACYSDEEYFQGRCQGSKEIYYQRYGRYNIDKIWRDDILPCRLYLRHCVLAAKNLGEPAYSNFLDHTYLGDRKTTIREYLATTGAGIMEEETPESLKSLRWLI